MYNKPIYYMNKMMFFTCEDINGGSTNCIVNYSIICSLRLLGKDIDNM